MKHTKAISGSIIIALVLVLLIVEVGPEMQRVSSQQAAIEERNTEIRQQQVASMGHPGLGIPEADQYIDNPESTSAAFAESAWYDGMP